MSLSVNFWYAYYFFRTSEILPSSQQQTTMASCLPYIPTKTDRLYMSRKNCPKKLNISLLAGTSIGWPGLLCRTASEFPHSFTSLRPGPPTATPGWAACGSARLAAIRHEASFLWLRCQAFNKSERYQTVLWFELDNGGTGTLNQRSSLGLSHTHRH